MIVPLYDELHVVFMMKAACIAYPKELAADALEAMGLTVQVPSVATRKAIAELEAGKGKRFHSVEDLMEELRGGDK
jgi:DNA-damage-inducible protein J